MWKTIYHALIEIFFPTECFFCQKPKSFLCPDCAALLDINNRHHYDHNCKYLDDIYAAGSYENKYLKQLITTFKYPPLLKSLGAPLAQLIADHFSLAQVNIHRPALIIPVPLSSSRLRWRGFNQAQIIAQELSKIWELPFDAKILQRVRETKMQAELGKEERYLNVKSAFACSNTISIKNQTIYLVDDVITTGATMEECARVLKNAVLPKLLD